METIDLNNFFSPVVGIRLKNAHHSHAELQSMRNELLEQVRQQVENNEIVEEEEMSVEPTAPTEPPPKESNKSDQQDNEDDEDDDMFGINFFIDDDEDIVPRSARSKKQSINEVTTVRQFLLFLLSCLRTKNSDGSVPTIWSLQDNELILQHLCKYLSHAPLFSEEQHMFTLQLLSALVSKFYSQSMMDNVIICEDSDGFNHVKYSIVVILRYCLARLQATVVSTQIAQQVLSLLCLIHSGREDIIQLPPSVPKFGMALNCIVKTEEPSSSQNLIDELLLTSSVHQGLSFSADFESTSDMFVSVIRGYMNSLFVSTQVTQYILNLLNNSQSNDDVVSTLRSGLRYLSLPAVSVPQAEYIPIVCKRSVDFYVATLKESSTDALRNEVVFGYLIALIHKVNDKNQVLQQLSYLVKNLLCLESSALCARVHFEDVVLSVKTAMCILTDSLQLSHTKAPTYRVDELRSDLLDVFYPCHACKEISNLRSNDVIDMSKYETIREIMLIQEGKGVLVSIMRLCKHFVEERPLRELYLIVHYLDMIIFGVTSNDEMMKKNMTSFIINHFAELSELLDIIDAKSDNFRQGFKKRISEIQTVFSASLELCDSVYTSLIDTGSEAPIFKQHVNHFVFCLLVRTILKNLHQRAKTDNGSHWTIQRLWSIYHQTILSGISVQTNTVLILLFFSYRATLLDRQNLLSKFIELAVDNHEINISSTAQLISLCHYMICHMDGPTSEMASFIQDNFFLNQRREWCISGDNATPVTFTSCRTASPHANTIIQTHGEKLLDCLSSLICKHSIDKENDQLIVAVNLYQVLLNLPGISCSNKMTGLSSCIRIAFHIFSREEMDVNLLFTFMKGLDHVLSQELSDQNLGLLCSSFSRMAKRVLKPNSEPDQVNVIVTNLGRLVLVSIEHWVQYVTSSLLSCEYTEVQLRVLSRVIRSVMSTSRIKECVQSILGTTTSAQLLTLDSAWIEEKCATCKRQTASDDPIDIIHRHCIKSSECSADDQRVVSLVENLSNLIDMLEHCESIPALRKESIVGSLLLLESSNVFSFVSTRAKQVLDTTLGTEEHNKRASNYKIRSLDQNISDCISSLADRDAPFLSRVLFVLLDCMHSELIPNNIASVVEYMRCHNNLEKYQEVLQSFFSRDVQRKCMITITSLLNSSSDLIGQIVRCIHKHDESSLWLSARLSQSEQQEDFGQFTTFMRLLYSNYSVDSPDSDSYVHLYTLLCQHFHEMVRSNSNDATIEVFNLIVHISISLQREDQLADDLSKLVREQVETSQRNFLFLSLVNQFLLSSLDEHTSEIAEQVKQCTQSLCDKKQVVVSLEEEKLRYTTGILNVDDCEDQVLAPESLNATLTFLPASDISGAVSSSHHLSEISKKMIDNLQCTAIDRERVKTRTPSLKRLISSVMSLSSKLQRELIEQSDFNSLDQSTTEHWSLENITSVGDVPKSITELKTTLPSNSFKTEMNFESRSEKSIASRDSIHYQLLSSSSKGDLAIGEDTNVAMFKLDSFCDMQSTESRANMKQVSSLSVPFKITHVRFNSANGNFLAVAGMFDTHVFVLDEERNPTQQIQIYLGFDDMPNETYLTDVLWLPDSQVLLAIVTNRFVKVYDLSSDTFCPVFNFAPQDGELLVSTTFGLTDDEQPLLFALTESGQLYYQEYMDSGGPCTFTQSIDISTLSGAQDNKKGMSVYYDMNTKLIYFSFSEGNTVACTINTKTAQIIKSLIISSQGGESSSKGEVNQLAPFYQWQSIPELPGHVVCLSKKGQTVLFAFSKENLWIEVIENVSVVHGITGTTVTRPSFCYVCLDGSLNYFEISNNSITHKSETETNIETTEPVDDVDLLLRGFSSLKASVTTSSPSLSKHMFTNQTNISTSMKYSGEILTLFAEKDVLQLLSNEDGHIAYNQPGKLDLTVENLDPSATVISKIRVLVGKHSLSSIPKTVRVGEVCVETKPNIEQWVDINIPILNCTDDKTVCIELSATHSNQNVVVDQIEVYGVSSSRLRFEQAKIKLNGNNENLSPIVSVASSPDKHSPPTLLFVLKQFLAVVLPKYIQATKDEDNSIQAEAHRLLSDCFVNRQLHAICPHAISSIVSLCDYQSDRVVETINDYLLKFVDAVDISSLNTLDLLHVLKATNSLLLSSPESLLPIFTSNPNLLHQLVTKLEVLRNEKLHSQGPLVYTIIGISLLQLRGNNSDVRVLAILDKLLFDSDEFIVSEVSKAISSLIMSCPLMQNLDEDNQSMYGLLIRHYVQNMKAVRSKDSLSALYFYKSLLDIVDRYLCLSDESTKLKSCSYLESVFKDVISNLFGDGDRVFNIAKQSEDNQIHLVELLFFTCLIGMVGPNECVSSTVAVLAQLCNNQIGNEKYISKLKKLLTDVAEEYDREESSQRYSEITDGGLLKPQKNIPDRNFSPLLSQQYLHDNKQSMFRPYAKLLTQVIFQMIYNIKVRSAAWTAQDLVEWNAVLSQLALNKHSPFIRQRSKDLLIRMNGSLDDYFKVTDNSLYASELLDFYNPLTSVTAYPEEKATELMISLGQVLARAVDRQHNWSQFCLHHPTIYVSLALFASHFVDDTCLTPIKLMHLGLLNSDDSHKKVALAALANNTELDLSGFIDSYALVSNSDAVRIEACNILALLSLGDSDNVTNTIVSKISNLPRYGRKAEQFLNILLSQILQSENATLHQTIIHLLTCCLKQENMMISEHPNLRIYNTLKRFMNFSEYYLESSPCAICNSVEEPFIAQSFNDIKKLIKHEHASQYLLFNKSYMISSIDFNASISAPSKKMVRTLELYYNNKSDLSIADLREASWKKFGTMDIPKGAEKASLTLPLPIIASNVMVEFSSFYEDLLSSDRLMCPNCRIPVVDRHGVCASCNDNAYQCIKCRNVNYGELDGFFCSVCGHSKYGSFTFGFSARESHVSDEIKDEKDSKAAIILIEKQLEIAHEKYDALQSHRDVILDHLEELEDDTRIDDDKEKLNTIVESLYDLYVTDAGNLFKELSACMKTLSVTRHQLMEYLNRNRSNKQLENNHTNNNVQPQSRCFACANNFVRSTLNLLLHVEQSYAPDCIGELAQNTLKYGVMDNRKLTRKVISHLVRSNLQGSQMLNNILRKRIDFALANHRDLDLNAFIRHEMLLLCELNHESIECFENHIGTVFEIMLKAIRIASFSTSVCEKIVVPCLTVLTKFLESSDNEPADSETDEMKNSTHSHITMQQWASGRRNMKQWINSNAKAKNKGFEAIQFSNSKSAAAPASNLPINPYLIKNLLLNKVSRDTRTHMLSLLQLLCKANPDRELELLKVLCYCLSSAMSVGEAAEEYFSLLFSLVESEERKYFLGTDEYLTMFSSNLMTEVDRIEYLEKLGSDVVSDLSQGTTLGHLVLLINDFLKVPDIMREFKEKKSHISAILNSFLSLRTLITQRTSKTSLSCDVLQQIIDRLRETEKDKEFFLEVCIDALKTRSDNLSSIFIFERLCNLIVPFKEEPSYELDMERHDSQQYFFQGGMRNNPYTSHQIGTTMSDVAAYILKEMNICSDFALELLVKDKIINLNLEITKVYEQVWMREEGDTPMEVIFRFQGVDGEATEDVIDELEDDSVEQDLEELCKITSGMSKYNRLELVLQYVDSITDENTDRILIKYVLQFLLYCTYVKKNRRKLLMVNAVQLLLTKCKFVFSNPDLFDLAEMILLIIKPIVEEATRMSFESNASPLTPMSPYMSGDDESANTIHLLKKNSEDTLNQLVMFLDKLPSMSPKIVNAVSKVLPFLTYGEKESCEYLINYFKPHLNLDEYNQNQTKENTFYLSTFVTVSSAIPNDMAGNHLKNMILESGITENIFSHLCSLFDDKDDGNDQTGQDAYNLPSVHFAINLLVGLCTSHHPSQKLLLVRASTIEMLHRMEENVHAKDVATLAELLLNKLAENGFEASADINSIRSKTKKKKRRKANNTRNKLLKDMGLSITQTGGIKQDKIVGFDLDQLTEETGLTCCICGDGYGFKPQELLGIYNFAKVASFGDFTGFSSVTSFTTIHISCHTQAAEADENLRPSKSVWEGALIRNGFSKCNCLLPILGPENDKDAYTRSVEHYWTQMANIRAIKERFKTTSFDLTSLLLKLAKLESLSIDSGGGSTLHNLKLIPFEIQMALLVLDDANERTKYEAVLNDFLSSPVQGLSTVSDRSAFWNCVLSLFLMSLEEWNTNRFNILKKLIEQSKQDALALNHVITSSNLFEHYRTPILFFCIVNEIQNSIKQSSEETPATSASNTTSIHHANDAPWISAIKTRIQKNHMEILNQMEHIADTFYPKLKSATTVEACLNCLSNSDSSLAECLQWIAQQTAE